MPSASEWKSSLVPRKISRTSSEMSFPVARDSLSRKHQVRVVILARRSRSGSLMRQAPA